MSFPRSVVSSPESSRPITASDLEALLDNQPLSVRQILIICLCFAVATFDGLDLAIMGFIAPAIRADWQMKPSDLGWLFSGGLIGLSVGALAAGPLADILGRNEF